MQKDHRYSCSSLTLVAKSLTINNGTIDINVVELVYVLAQLNFTVTLTYFYRPQTKFWGKVIFSVACVKNSVQRMCLITFGILLPFITGQISLI